MIYTGLNKTGEVQVIHTHGGGTVGAVYGGINEANPIYYKTRTLTGQAPLSYKALGKPLSDYLLSGNTIQNGTPTPSDPVDVVGAGERTENLFDYLTMANGSIGYLKNDGTINPAESWEITKYIPVSGKSFTLVFDGMNATPSMCAYDLSKNFITGVSYNNNSIVHISSESNIAYIRFSYKSASHPDQTDLSILMLNTGSTAIPYEPYGFKLTPTVNGTEYPIYLGQVPTTRRIKKLVLTGNEDWQTQTGQYRNDTALFLIWQRQLVKMRNRPSMNTHFISAETGVNPQTQGFVCSGYHPNADYSDYYYIRTHFTTIGITSETTGLDAITAFKSWLAAQHANGTPVTVWYVMSEPETGIVNEPLMKIGDYADTLSMAQAAVTIPTVAGANTLTVDTTVQPSAVSITGNIKEVST